MTTGIRGVNNKSGADVHMKNHENHGDDVTIPPNSNADWAYAWISQHREKPLKIHTLHDILSVWDEDWKIMYRWEREGRETVWKRFGRQPLDFRLTVNEQGYVFIDEI